MFRRMLIGAAVLLALAAAPAAAQYDFTVTPGQVEAGGVVSVAGSGGCHPNEQVTITLTQISAAKAVGDKIVITTLTTNAEGEFSGSFTVPAGTQPGTYDVTAHCNNDDVGTAELVVVKGSTVTTPGHGAGGPIVKTGSDLNGLGMVGASLLIAGGIVLVATKSRRDAARA